MEEFSDGKAKRAIKKGAKLTGLTVTLLIFILLLFMVLGIILDRYVLRP